MPLNFQQIVKEVNNTTQLDGSLLLVVQRPKSSIDVDACSVYLNDTETDRLILAGPVTIPTLDAGDDKGLLFPRHRKLIHFVNEAGSGFARVIKLVDMHCI